MAKKLKTYTAAQVVAYKARLFREYQKTIDEERIAAYQRGYDQGRRELRTNLYQVLGLSLTKANDSFQHQFVVVAADE